MNLKIILLLQLFVLVATATRESNPENPENSENEGEIAGQEERQEDQREELEENELILPQLDPSDCQFQVIKSCNQKFKSSFERKPGGPARNRMELYCKGIQSFMKCLEASTCRGPFVDNYRYVVLQHGMMDKKLNLCPNHVYTTLRTKVQAITMKHLFIDDIGADSSTQCSVEVHKKCVKTFTKNMETNSNMCQDVQSFLICYKKESPKCMTKITQHFTHLCNQLGEQMLKANEKHRGMMC
ncbi:uncharacterized protein LOC116308791 [Actinia tenebrosa]|uniref:Uncharacterized protein LOC116308791 n=1 Tax=Actinia tenebrosa TaxID=6105 RepID=A0A6P8J4Z3_ACTTE|nr:uncharacterized protein LOC116308791 [Actinia tenebrosa]XP_031575141.1 uncharacterized protein LOC116308791 [Actinia tenebrosa]